MADINGVERTYANKDEYDFEGGEYDSNEVDTIMQSEEYKREHMDFSELLLNDYIKNKDKYKQKYQVNKEQIKENVRNYKKRIKQQKTENNTI